MRWLHQLTKEPLIEMKITKTQLRRIIKEEFIRAAGDQPMQEVKPSETSLRTSRLITKLEALGNGIAEIEKRSEDPYAVEKAQQLETELQAIWEEMHDLLEGKTK